MKNNSHFISVVVPAYNEEKCLSYCLNRLNMQICTWDYEIIVVDNASTDQTSKIATTMKARVVFEPERGIARALQTGFNSAKGTIIAVTEADTYVPPLWLQMLCQPLVTYPSVVATTSPYEFYDNQAMNFIAKLWFKFGGYLAKRLPVLIKRGYFALVGPSYAVKANIFHNVGGFNTDLRTSVDLDLSLKLSAEGRILFLPVPLVYTSARRFNHNLKQTALIYLCNYLSMTTTKRPIFNSYPDYR